MEHKTAVERLKEQEDDINSKAQIRGFMVDITDNGDNTGSITIWRIDKGAKTFKEMLIFVETLKIKGVAMYQAEIIKDNEILEHGLSLSNISKWIFNRLNTDSIEYMCKFYGGKYDRQTMTKEQVEKFSNGKTSDLTHIREHGGTVHRKELDNQPLVNGYLSPMFSHIDYGIIYLRYETQEVYNMMPN